MRISLRRRQLSAADALVLIIDLLVGPCAAATTRPSKAAAQRRRQRSRQRSTATVSAPLSQRSDSDGESVVLADCRSDDGTNSSEMAYYPGPGTPYGTPQSKAIVSTPSGESAVWVDSTTSAIFTTTDVTFTAVIGQPVANGSYAGTGSNGYRSFTCWETYQAQLYMVGDITCSQVYLCNHLPAPPSTTPSVSPSSAPSSSNSASTSIGSLPVGAEVAIAIGAVASLLFVAATIAGCVLRRRLRSRRRRNPVAELPAFDRKGTCTSNKGSEPVDPAEQQKQMVVPVYEMDGQWFRREMDMGVSDHRAELAGHRTPELDSAQRLEMGRQERFSFEEPPDIRK